MNCCADGFVRNIDDSVNEMMFSGLVYDTLCDCVMRAIRHVHYVLPSSPREELRFSTPNKNYPTRSLAVVTAKITTTTAWFSISSSPKGFLQRRGQPNPTSTSDIYRALSVSGGSAGYARRQETMERKS